MAPTLRVAFGLNDLSEAEIRDAVAEQVTKIVAPQ
jgi:TetR/AcrR family transcriptional regulator, repressor for neighboring sulfatase